MIGTIAVPYTAYCFGHGQYGTPGAFLPDGRRRPYDFGPLVSSNGEEAIAWAIHPRSEVRGVRIGFEDRKSSAQAGGMLHLIEGMIVPLRVPPNRGRLILDRHDRTDGLLVLVYCTRVEEIEMLPRNIAMIAGVSILASAPLNDFGANVDVHLHRQRGGAGARYPSPAVRYQATISRSVGFGGTYSIYQAMAQSEIRAAELDSEPFDDPADELGLVVGGAIAGTAAAQTLVYAGTNGGSYDYTRFRFNSQALGATVTRGRIEVCQ